MNMTNMFILYILSIVVMANAIIIQTTYDLFSIQSGTGEESTMCDATRVISGVYIYRLTVEQYGILSYEETGKMVLFQ